MRPGTSHCRTRQPETGRPEELQAKTARVVFRAVAELCPWLGLLQMIHTRG